MILASLRQEASIAASSCRSRVKYTIMPFILYDYDGLLSLPIPPPDYHHSQSLSSPSIYLVSVYATLILYLVRRSILMIARICFLQWFISPPSTALSTKCLYILSIPNAAAMYSTIVVVTHRRSTGPVSVLTYDMTVQNCIPYYLHC